MPAIQLARLKIQVTELLRNFENPQDFGRELHTLFEFYADRTRHPGRAGKPKPLIQAYNVPKQVMHRIESDLKPLALADPDSALELADQLWVDPWYESRLLAINILGIVPPEPSDIIVARLQTWGKTCKDDVLLNTLLDDGATRIRDEFPDIYLSLVEIWLSDSDFSARKIGLRALPALILNPEFENLPMVYRLLTPFLREVSSVLETGLVTILRALGQRSPQETAYFLRQLLTGPYKSELTIVVRRSLDVFPLNLQDSLRTVMREQMRSTNGVS